MDIDPTLPIAAALPALAAALAAGSSAVLVAPPGAGKTTGVPLALLGAAWLGTKRIIVLEPRRLAARGAAARMAAMLGEEVGGTIGLRARLTTRVGPRTLIEVVTEGVFTRMILDDPALEGVGAVLLDEFHERSLDADLALALALDVQRGLRPELRLLVMSATLEGARVARLLGGAEVIRAEGRAFPVETRYLGRGAGARIEERIADAVTAALRAETGSILAFLPGQGEIRRTAERLAERIRDPAVEIAPLYGAMDMAAQDRAVRPAPPGRRKIVLATAIAETSLTIEGVRVVIDCGLARVPRYEPGVGFSRLETVRVSRAAADQRRGRAGRTEPGVCYRLWDEPATQGLAPYAEPEILNADLAGLLLDLAGWGVGDPASLAWLDPPPRTAVATARAELEALGALDRDGRITELGRRLQGLALPARLARMVIAAGERGAAAQAAEVAAVIVERGLGGGDADLAERLRAFRADRSRRAEDMRRLAAGWARAAAGGGGGTTAELDPAALLALAYPERIAKARGAPGQYLLANGRAGSLDPTHPLARAPFLVVAELQGAAAAARILLAAGLEEAVLAEIAGDRIRVCDERAFDAAAAAVRARRVRRLDAIVLESAPRPVDAGAQTARLLAEGVAGLGLARLPWTKAQRQLRDRVLFVRRADPASGLPDLSDDTLAAAAAEWLAPFLLARTRLDEITADDLEAALDALLPWDARRRLAEAAPTHFEAPTGNRHPIDYEAPGAPLIRIRVQELFGLAAHPAIAGGRLALTLELLSPAQRPIQITRDLPGFWAGSWSAVRAEMRGRYPRHPWPEDPVGARPTTRAKPRGT
jgi:ATP-dependent helicase HrpB